MKMTVTPVFDDIDLEIIAEALSCYKFHVEVIGKEIKLGKLDSQRVREAALLLEMVEEILHSEGINIVER